jgi:hypothetical protein
VTKSKVVAVFLISFLASAVHPVWADLRWTTLAELTLQGEPLDVTSSADGKSLFVLTPGEILVYSTPENALEKKIPVGEGFDRITYSPALHALVLTSRGSKTLKILKLQDIHPLDLSGLPFKGPEGAPVTVVVFSGYQ